MTRSCLVARDDRAKILPPLWQKLAETKRQGTLMPLRTVCPCRPEKIGFPHLVCHFSRLFTSPSALFGSSNSCPLLLFPHSYPSALPTLSDPHSGPCSLSLSHSLWSVSLTLSLPPSAICICGLTGLDVPWPLCRHPLCLCLYVLHFCNLQVG